MFALQLCEYQTAEPVKGGRRVGHGVGDAQPEILRKLAHLNELFHECTYEWKEADWDANGSLAGYLLTGPNGNTIFLPAAGDRWDSDLNNVGSYSSYWSAELYSGDSRGACSLDFYLGGWTADYYSRRGYGFPVRPVCPSAE
ncbi:MAG: hypothetical protein ACI35Q_08110 [Marinilabiliaceae bacterium]